MRTRALLFAASGLLLLGCGSAADHGHVGTQSAAIISSDEIAYIDTLTSAERDGTVAFVNDPATTFDMLDVDCGLYSNAAKWLVRTRPFADIYAVADTKEVGIANLTWTVECARAHGFIPTPVTTHIEVFADLDPKLQSVVTALIADAEAKGGPAYETFHFFEADVTTLGGTYTGAKVRIGRVIDPEGGIVETVDYTLDENYQVIDEYWDAG